MIKKTSTAVTQTSKITKKNWPNHQKKQKNSIAKIRKCLGVVVNIRWSAVCIFTKLARVLMKLQTTSTPIKFNHKFPEGTATECINFGVLNIVNVMQKNKLYVLLLPFPTFKLLFICICLFSKLSCCTFISLDFSFYRMSSRSVAFKFTENQVPKR